MGTEAGGILPSGAETGFVHEVSLRMTEKSFDVIAGVEIASQVFTLSETPRKLGRFLAQKETAVACAEHRQKEPE
ncbi:short chain dehydrogenase [Acetobacter aceti NRIC 0242]|uniref:Uncharacterized protein n=1 Tax=Acetobacter aceti NBRC 14818 TaxID=887700 RepID=A0AB33IBZ1_ACEAC|nr:hypothetical protein [Acetobacter aceti]TCS35464.1 hypothetical protein EDC15_101263 [Acetobacter aceti NBRC 14818]BCK75149.1 hypothetical protein EMQ_0755 [Acetobacter aceti NBRC 14818]GAN57561.1 short chain dehydrogenase [Acetobacter aceti NBRC 14818]GBO79333.1 short chain dehydrogenase [Acetobacter aceti NRIC 0242]